MSTNIFPSHIYTETKKQTNIRSTGRKEGRMEERKKGMIKRRMKGKKERRNEG